jgi:asparagine synthase (glutamine-hydrolysing)
MCGIAGCFLRTRDDAAARAGRMAECMAHRGPDGDGLAQLRVCGWDAAIVHRRLAIIDLTPEAAQPMHEASSGVVLVFNGEIYNYLDVRSRLTALGHRFVSRSDTEVLLRAYLEWGRDALAHLDGMFAFALWDPRTESLFLARDRFGIKPLYYFMDADRFVFASEVRSLLESGVVPRILNREMVAPFLQTGSVVSPDTLVRDVHSLAPGHSATWRDGRLVQTQYWTLAEAMERGGLPPSRDELSETFLSAVRSEMVSDVPIGLFLSGGVDSSALVSALATEGDLRTVSLVFEESAYDERIFSRQVARAFGTVHTEIDISSKDVADDLIRLPERQDQPSADGLNTYLVSRAAREAGLTVALSGLGGDEIFAGYPSFKLARRWPAIRMLRHLPSPLRAALGAVAAPLLGTRRHKAGRVLTHVSSIEQLYTLTRELHSPSAVQALTGMTIRDEPFEHGDIRDPVNLMTLLESGRYLLDTTLRQADGMSMAVSLEVRVPLLNHRLAELVMRTRPQDRFRAGVSKPLILDALRTPLPSDVVTRRKGTFTLPYADWLRSDHRPLAEELLFGAPTIARGIIDQAATRRLWEGFLARRPDVGWAQIWSLCTFEGWCRRHLDPGTS